MVVKVSSILNLLLANPELPFHKIGAEETPTEELKIDFEEQSNAVKALKTDTNEKVIQLIKQYLAGEVELEELDIHPETALSYLAAAKIVDLTRPYRPEERSTLAIRERCLAQEANPQTGERIPLLNALTIPPPEEQDIEFLNRLYTLDRDKRVQLEMYSRQKAYFHPKTIEKINRVFQRALDTVVQSTEYLKTKEGKNVWFSGSYGAGKSYQIRKFTEGQDPANLIYGTDQFQRYLKDEFPQSGDNTRFLFALGLRKELEQVLKTKYTGALFLQEGIFCVERDIDTLFSETPNVQIYDLDAPFRELALRVLSRERKFNFDAVKSNVQRSRNCRNKLIAKAETYQMRVGEQILSKEQALAQNELLLQEKFDEVGDSLITAEEGKRFGEDVQKYVGQTIRDALNHSTGTI